MTSIHLALRSVSKSFRVGARSVRAVEGISVEVAEGECLAIVGESGSGKSTLANLVLGVYAPDAGSIMLDGATLPARRSLANRRMVQLVQQNPLSSLNPKRTVGASIRLSLDVHGIGKPSSRASRIGLLLEEVGLPAEFAERSPAALSGGQRQRVAIARALACESRLVVLDEPTSSLDVIVQARILRLLKDLRAARGLTYVFITHDLAVVRNVADRVMVLKDGARVEIGETARIFTCPEHAYTRGLIAASPVIAQEEQDLRDRLRQGIG